MEKSRRVARGGLVEMVLAGEAGELGPAAELGENLFRQPRLGQHEIDSRQIFMQVASEPFCIRDQDIFARHRQPLGKNRREKNIHVEAPTEAEEPFRHVGITRFSATLAHGIARYLITVLFQQHGDKFQVEAVAETRDG